MLSKLLKVSVLTLLAYLLQATTAEYLSIWDIAPSLALAIIAVATVGLGRKYTFLMSLAVGYLLEIMLPMLDYLALILYPVCCMLGALAFSDKSERRLEEERAAGRRARQWNPHIRTPLCAVLSAAVFEGVNLIYVYLSGVALDGGHFGRALVCVLYTAAIAAVIQFPIRWWLGVYKLAKAR